MHFVHLFIVAVIVVVVFAFVVNEMTELVVVCHLPVHA